MTTLWLIVACGVLAIVYGIWATLSVLGADQGSARMQEISAAVREGAQAYLKRQYTTIAIVGIVIFLIVGWLLGWLVGIGLQHRPDGPNAVHDREQTARDNQSQGCHGILNN